MAALSGRLSPLHKGVKNAQTFRRNSDWLMPTGHEQLTHVLESTGVQLDVEVGWTTVGSQIRWSAAVSHGENVVAVVHDVVTPFGVDIDYAVENCGASRLAEARTKTSREVTGLRLSEAEQETRWTRELRATCCLMVVQLARATSI